MSAVSQVGYVLGVQRIGRYEVLNHLASGGMGQVYLARATGLGGFERQVVVKTLDTSITDDDDAFITMFLDEARLVGALHHQYIAPVYEVGCDDEGRYYLVMDYVQGETAEAVFRASTDGSLPLPLSFALTVVSCVASALDYAHNLCSVDGSPLDIVHRDVSLSNVMIGHDGGVKLIDFGIAKAANRATRTQVGTLKGKIGYLAPEQVQRRPIDHRADIFALGIVLYELTTQTRAFRDKSDLLTLERITTGDVTRPGKKVSNYPPELEAIVMKALEVDPDKRFQNAGSMGRALERLAARMGIPLGHAPVAEVMAAMFERKSRRRFARGSNEPPTDPKLLDDGVTPIQEVNEEPTDPHELPLPPSIERSSLARSHKPTLPITGSRIQETGAEETAKFSRLAQGTPPEPPSFDAAAIDPPTDRDRKPLAYGTEKMPRLARPVTGPHRPSTGPQRALSEPGRRPSTGPLSESSRRPTTGPQQRLDVHEAPTEIQGFRERLVDPTPTPPTVPLDDGLPHVTFRQPTGTSLARPRWVPSAIAAKMPVTSALSTQMWLVMCALFAVAVVAAIVVAML
ncbi:MAG: protein kinase [Kofleriaceae bacterium]|nr:protein kinase [Kofleriaceae bacterium]